MNEFMVGEMVRGWWMGSGKMSKQVGEQMEWVGLWMGGCMGLWVDEWMGGQVSEEMGKYVAGQMGGWVSR